MVKNPNNVPAHAEMFDAERIREIEEMAVRYIKFQSQIGSPFYDFRFDPTDNNMPDNTFSDLECNVWSIIVDAVREGVKIGKQLS